MHSVLRRIVKAFIRVALFIVEGPDRPWWAWIALIVVPVPLVLVVSNTALGSMANWFICATPLGLLWFFVRRWQTQAVEHMAKVPVGTCPFCGYDVRSAQDDTCPECGRHAEADGARLRRTLGILESERRARERG